MGFLAFSLSLPSFLRLLDTSKSTIFIPHLRLLGAPTSFFFNFYTSSSPSLRPRSVERQQTFCPLSCRWK
ncbi:unnamed protein product [Hymenolepis diminuta]|uniref:Secreted protein n=1 Tax=Hymenolepis diminuta TaxID=6216 RepID=A0A0R3SQ86_HYMDI|nr:unnamed protein product [Hymenolepis diminuta]